MYTAMLSIVNTRYGDSQAFIMCRCTVNVPYIFAEYPQYVYTNRVLTFRFNSVTATDPCIQTTGYVINSMQRIILNSTIINIGITSGCTRRVFVTSVMNLFAATHFGSDMMAAAIGSTRQVMRIYIIVMILGFGHCIRSFGRTHILHISHAHSYYQIKLYNIISAAWSSHNIQLHLQVIYILLISKIMDRIMVAIHYGGRAPPLMQYVDGYMVISNMQFVTSECITQTDSYWTIYVCTFDHSGFFSLSYTSDFHVHTTRICDDCRAVSVGADSCGVMSTLITDGLRHQFPRTSHDEYTSALTHHQSQQPGAANNNYDVILDSDEIESATPIGGYDTTTATTTTPTTTPTTTTTKRHKHLTEYWGGG